MGNEGQGRSDGNGAGGDEAQQLSATQAELAALRKEHESLKASKTDLEQRLSDADAELLGEEFLSFKEEKRKKGSGTPPQLPQSGDIDLDRISNKELAEFVEKKYKGDIDSAVKSLREELDLSKRQIRELVAELDVTMTASRHDGSDGKPSFSEHIEELSTISKANPSWNSERCYRQLLLELKQKEDEKSEAARKKEEEELQFASEHAGASPNAVVPKQVSSEEAADIAFKKAFGNSKK